MENALTVFGAVGAGNTAASPGKKIWTKLIRFGHIRLELGEICSNLRQN